MKSWKNAEIVELDITETAYGKNPKAKEANANKHPNKGAGSIMEDIENEIDKEPDVTPDTLS